MVLVGVTSIGTNLRAKFRSLPTTTTLEDPTGGVQGSQPLVSRSHDLWPVSSVQRDSGESAKDWSPRRHPTQGVGVRDPSGVSGQRPVLGPLRRVLLPPRWTYPWGGWVVGKVRVRTEGLLSEVPTPGALSDV